MGQAKLLIAREGETEDGYWAGNNNDASGILPIARDTKRICLAWRNAETHTGDCWGTIGGAVKDGLTPEASAKAEMKEEVGYAGSITMHAGWVFQDGSFKYHNFVGVVDSEFAFAPGSEHAWETDGITWFDYEDILADMDEEPGDYHPELINFFEHSRDLIEKLVAKGEVKKASPDYGYSHYNNREEDLKKLDWEVWPYGRGFTVTAYEPQSLKYDDPSRKGVVSAAKITIMKRVSGVAEVYDPYVERHWKGTGLGQMLYDHAIAEAKARKFKIFCSDEPNHRTGDADSAWERLKKRYPVRVGEHGQFIIDLDQVVTKTASPDFGYGQYNDREQDLKKVSLVANGGDDLIDVNCYFGEANEENRVGGGACVRTQLRREKAYRVSIVRIAPEWRGTGLGQMIYDKLIEQARKRKAKWLISDDMMSDDAVNAWNRLSMRYPVDFSKKQFVLDLTGSKLKAASDEQEYEPWIGVDLDGTLAKNYEGPFDPLKIGDPVQKMVEKILFALADGMTVKVFTARMADKENAEKIRKAIGDYTEKHIGTRLDATNEKDPGCKEIWDDKARQVIEDTGVIVKAASSSLRLEKEVPKPIQDYYMTGGCHALAEALHQRSGLPIYGVFDDEGAMLHAFVANPSKGHGYDIRGEFNLDNAWDGAGEVRESADLLNESPSDVQEAMQVVDEYFTPKTAKTASPEFRIWNDCYDSHGGETFCTIRANNAQDEVVGYVDYSLYDDEIHIKMVDVAAGFRRQGIATRLIQKLREDNPGYSLNWGMLTEDGAALKDKVHRPEDEPPNRMLRDLEAARGDLAREAQEQYDSWPIPEFENLPGSGSLAEQIADALEWSVAHHTSGYGKVRAEGDDFVVDCNAREHDVKLYIPSSVFQERVGELWRKKEGVTITPDKIVITAPGSKTADNDKNTPGKATREYPEYSNGWALYPDQREGDQVNVPLEKLIPTA